MHGKGRLTFFLQKKNGRGLGTRLGIVHVQQLIVMAIAIWRESLYISSTAQLAVSILAYYI